MVVCIHCHHSIVDRNGYCRQEIQDSLSNGRFNRCWCKCQFPNEAPPMKSPSYTLKEIEIAASEYLDSEAVNRFRENGKDLTPELLISNLIAHLARREREGRG